MSAARNVGNVIKKKSGLGAIGAGTIFSVGMDLHYGISGYRDAREQGHGAMGSAVRGVSTSLMSNIVGFKAYMGAQAVMGAPKLAVKGVTKLDQMSRQMSRQHMNRPFDNATFADSKQAYTMRQAGMQLAKASKHNLQQGMMGNEANMMHM